MKYPEWSLFSHILWQCNSWYYNYHNYCKISSFLMFVIITMQFMLLPYWMKIEEFTKHVILFIMEMAPKMLR